MPQAVELVNDYLSGHLSLEQLQVQLYAAAEADPLAAENAEARRILGEATSGDWATEDVRQAFEDFVRSHRTFESEPTDLAVQLTRWNVVMSWTSISESTETSTADRLSLSA